LALPSSSLINATPSMIAKLASTFGVSLIYSLYVAGIASLHSQSLSCAIQLPCFHHAKL
jgi:hypothetical protein